MDKKDLYKLKTGEGFTPTNDFNKELPSEVRIPVNVDNLYNFKIKKLFNQCGYTFYRVRDYDRLAGIPDLYFFNETFSAWASLKADGRFKPGPGKIFKPKYKRGEIVFLRKCKEIENVKSLVIMEFNDLVYYCSEIKAEYKEEDLIPFTLEGFFP